MQAECDAHGIQGVVLVAHEGINGTVAGRPEAVRHLLAWLRADPRLAELEHKEALGDKAPFYRMRVRFKPEIVTLGVPEVDPVNQVGSYVAARDWNRLIGDPDVVVIDTRNDYEVAIGTFEGAVNPHTASFRELPQWVDSHADMLRGKKVAMFCTGGIRCEKSTALMRQRGYDEVYHLQGGILKYPETVGEAANGGGDGRSAGLAGTVCRHRRRLAGLSCRRGRGAGGLPQQRLALQHVVARTGVDELSGLHQEDGLSLIHI